MRCALVGAFHFPHAQGSQVFAGDQALGLAKLGCEVEMLCYGSQEASPGITRIAINPRLAPRSARSGPHFKKPVADLALARSIVVRHRAHRFDVVLAHNAEAAVAALVARPFTRVPVIYVAHTLMQNELSAYAHSSLQLPIDRLGRGIDRAIARRVDAALVLCDAAHAELEPHCRGPVNIIPPGLDPGPAPDLETCRRACARAGVHPGNFTLYAGNLDPYQDLSRLAGAARHLAKTGHVVLVASHETNPKLQNQAEPLRLFSVRDFEEMRSLIFSASELVLTRTRQGGFPVKLLNYMESGRPIVAFEDLAPGLRHGESAWLLPPKAGAEEIAQALATLRREPELADRIGSAGRRRLEQHHGASMRAQETLDLARRTAARASRKAPPR